jgi:glycosyltransferase involved in cell wall biosynthesis
MRCCMVAYSQYERDNRVRRYAETLARRGDQVDVLSLKRPGQGDFDEIKGVQVHRIQTREMNEKGKLAYLSRILRFFVKSSVILTGKHWRHPYDLVHVHSVPDFEVFAALVPKLKGAGVILDIHDLVPEFYCSKFGRDYQSRIFKTLLLLEKCSALFADHVVAANHIWYKKLVGRSVKENKCTVILNYPDSSIFYRRTRTPVNGKFVMIYPGTLNWHQGLEVAINAFGLVRDEIPEAEFHIYGDGPSKTLLADLIKNLGLQERIMIKGVLPLDQMAAVMAEADLGIVPKRNDPFGGEAFSTKILEFMALGVPALVSRTRIDDYYFNDSVVRFFKPEDEKDLAEKMLLLVRDRPEGRRLAAEAAKFLEDYTWEKNQQTYLNLVDHLSRS